MKIISLQGSLLIALKLKVGNLLVYINFGIFQVRGNYETASTTDEQAP